MNIILYYLDIINYNNSYILYLLKMNIKLLNKMPEIGDSDNLIAKIKIGKETINNIKGISEEPVSKKVDIIFKKPFYTNPICVFLSNVSFDLGGDNGYAMNVRYRLKYENLTKEGFTLIVETWHDTNIYFIDVQWLVLGSLA